MALRKREALADLEKDRAEQQDYLIHEIKEHIALMEIVVRKTEQQLAEREIKLHADRILHLKETKTLRAQEGLPFA